MSLSRSLISMVEADWRLENDWTRTSNPIHHFRDFPRCAHGSVCNCGALISLRQPRPLPLCDLQKHRSTEEAYRTSTIWRCRRELFTGPDSAFWQHWAMLNHNICRPRPFSFISSLQSICIFLLDILCSFLDGR